MSKVSISIVLYNNDYLEVKKTLDSVLSANIDIAIYLIDNSEKSTLKAFLPEDKRIRYIKNDFNIGLWVVADNLRKGAALNAVQIAELLGNKVLKKE